MNQWAPEVIKFSDKMALIICKDQYQAKSFAMTHKGVIGQYLDGRWFVVYEKEKK